MRGTMMAGAAALATMIAAAAGATPIAAGGSVTAAPVLTNATTVLATYSNVAFTSQAPAGQSSTFSGTYTTSVYRDSANTLCATAGQCLSFAIQVTNSAGSTDPIETVTTGPFSNLFTYNVGYTTSSGTVTPLYINDNIAGVISFNFTGMGNAANGIGQGLTSNVLVIQTSATQYRAGNVSFQDGQTATVAGFIPSVPEPASWAMMVAGFGLVGAGLRRRKAAVSFA